MIYYVQIKSAGVPDIPALLGAHGMYKTEKAQQLTFDGFNQSCGMKLNPKDEYVILNSGTPRQAWQNLLAERS